MAIESTTISLPPDFRTHVYEALRQWYADPSEGSAIDYLAAAAMLDMLERPARAA